MPVTSTTLAGINVWRFSGVVTNAELRSAWAALIVANRYKPARAIYLDNTADITGLRGSFYVELDANGIILHSSRDKSKTAFNNFEFTQTVGLSVANRANLVRFTDGTTVAAASTDGLDMNGGAFIYAVTGNPGGGDPRYLNELQLGTLNGTLITSAAFTEQDLEPSSYGVVWRGITLPKCSGFPILDAPTERQVVYRSSINAEAASRIVRAYNNSCICYVSCIVRRAGVAVTSELFDTYIGTSTVIMVLNTWADETFFGASKTSIAGANWAAGNRFIGGVLKKIQTQPSTLINVYDSRSTTAPQKSTFSETTSDFLSGTTGTTTDAVTGRATFVVVAAIATGAGCSITRYTGQRFTLQKFGFRVAVQSVDMTSGDDDLSAFAPITMTAQTGLVRSQATIQAATSISTFDQLLEELHNLAVTHQGAQSYAAAYGGNLFSLDGDTLNTSFAAVTVDATAAQKITYNHAANSLTIKSATLASGSFAKSWVNTAGAISTANGAAISGVIEDSAGVRVIVTKQGGGVFNIAARYGTTGAYTDLGFQAGVSSVTYTVPKGQPVEVVMWALGHVTYSRLISTVDGGSALVAEMVANPAINTSLDVSAYIANIALSLDTSGASPVFVITFNAPMTVSGIEMGKAVIHRLVGQEVPLRSGFPPGATSTVAIVADEITNNLPAIRLAVGAGLAVTDRVYLDFFINTAPALVLNPAYVINPPRADGNQVVTLRAKPALDASVMAAAVRAELGVELGRLDAAVSTRLATAGYTAPANADVAAIKAKTDNLPALPAAVGSAMTLTAAYDAAKTAATQTSVDAIPTNPVLATDNRLSNLDAAISTRSTLTAPQVRTELATELGRLDAPVSSRLATSGYMAPANADIAAIKAKTDVLVNADLSGVATAAQVAALGSPLQASSYTAPANADIAAIKAKTDTLQNADLSGVATAAQVTALAQANQTEHDATQAAIAAIPAAPTAQAVADEVKAKLPEVGLIPVLL